MINVTVGLSMLIVLTVIFMLLIVCSPVITIGSTLEDGTMESADGAATIEDSVIYKSNATARNYGTTAHNSGIVSRRSGVGQTGPPGTIQHKSRIISNNAVRTTNANTSTTGTYATYPAAGVFDPSATYNPNSETTGFHIIFLISGNNYYSTTAGGLKLTSPAKYTGLPTYSTGTTYSPVKIVSNRNNNGFYLIDNIGLAIYTTPNTPIIASIQILAMDFYPNNSQRYSAIASMDGEEIYTGIIGSPQTDGDFPVGNYFSYTGTSYRGIGLNVSTISQPITPILDFTMDNVGNLYILGQDKKVYWVASSSADTSASADIVDSEVIELDPSVNGFTSISASKKSGTTKSALYGLILTSGVPTLYYINTGSKMVWTPFTAITNLTSMSGILDFDMTDYFD